MLRVQQQNVIPIARKYPYNAADGDTNKASGVLAPVDEKVPCETFVTSSFLERRAFKLLTEVELSADLGMDMDLLLERLALGIADCSCFVISFKGTTKKCLLLFQLLKGLSVPLSSISPLLPT